MEIHHNTGFVLNPYLACPRNPQHKHKKRAVASSEGILCFYTMDSIYVQSSGAGPREQSMAPAPAGGSGSLLYSQKSHVTYRIVQGV